MEVPGRKGFWLAYRCPDTAARAFLSGERGRGGGRGGVAGEQVLAPLIGLADLVESEDVQAGYV